MSFMFIISLILITTFLINYIGFWAISLKFSYMIKRFENQYLRVYSIIWKVIICPLPFIGSSFFEPIFHENISYFRQYWIWFLLLGLIFFIVGIRIQLSARKILKRKVSEGKGDNLFTKGIYRIVRHPVNLAWILIFFGLTFILDSFFAVLFTPFLIILIEVSSILEEKYLLVPKYGLEYENYMKKIPYRLISPPYNFLLAIIGFIVLYFGFLNLNHIL